MYQLFLAEKQAVTKGFIACYIICLPFTFLPALFTDGPLLKIIIDRLPLSLLYTFGFSFLLILSALYQNYDRQKIKLSLFNSMAFKALGFNIFTSGHGSLFKDLNVYLTGSYDDMFFNIDVVHDEVDKEKDKLIIEPIITFGKAKDRIDTIKKLKNKLTPGLTFSHGDNKLEFSIPLQHVLPDDEHSIKKYLNMINSQIDYVPQKMEAFQNPLFEDLV